MTKSVILLLKSYPPGDHILSDVPYENGIGALWAEARMVASEKGYKNGIGAMSAEARMAVRKKGDKMSIK